MTSLDSGTVLRRGERAELARQGAKAAARGDSGATNPLDAAVNSPPTTGESADTWLERRNAWQAGYDRQTQVARDDRPASAGGRDDELD